MICNLFLYNYLEDKKMFQLLLNVSDDLYFFWWLAGIN